jgi:hypothetical protein
VPSPIFNALFQQLVVSFDDEAVPQPQGAQTLTETRNLFFSQRPQTSEQDIAYVTFADDALNPISSVVASDGVFSETRSVAELLDGSCRRTWLVRFGHLYRPMTKRMS